MNFDRRHGHRHSKTKTVRISVNDDASERYRKAAIEAAIEAAAEHVQAHKDIEVIEVESDSGDSN